MELRTIRDGELDTWAEHCASVFSGPEDTPDYFRNHYLLDPHGDPRAVFIAEEGGVIASTLRVFRREIYIEGEKVPMGGIGEVSTKPAFQRRGLSGALLRMAIEYMEREGLATSMLFTGVNSHYARYGWFTQPARRLVVESRPADEPIRPMAEADLPAVRALCEAHHSRLCGCVARDCDAYWSAWMPGAWRAPHVLERSGRLVAYVDAVARDGALRLRDFAEADGGPGIARALASLAAALGEPGARIAIPAAFAPDVCGPFIESMSCMLRLNAPFSVRGERIDAVPKLAARLANAVFFGADSF